jgi:hypothetical protein
VSIRRAQEPLVFEAGTFGSSDFIAVKPASRSSV